MLTKYGGRFYDVLQHWWFTEEKNSSLQKAIKDNQALPVSDIEHTFWKDF
jgi:hypothetical protein